MRTHGGVSTVLVTIALGTALPDASAGSHRVAAGASRWQIARAGGCDADAVRRANRLTGTRIRPGQKLRIPSCDGKRVAVKADSSIVVPRGRVLQSIGRPQRGRLMN